ncbi:MAG: type II secretion system protein [Rickettsiales bacterium]|jgi:prepilin-type N-terminal cleavage/methylation domain-containing protein
MQLAPCHPSQSSQLCNKDKTLNRKRQAGFTLIELSIVLVIIGLIVGGVLVGRDLIRAAEIRSIATQKETIITSIMTFKLKYNCIAGDCANATNFFGTNPAGCVVATPTDSAPTKQTCDGNGDGNINITTQVEPYFNMATLVCL